MERYTDWMNMGHSICSTLHGYHSVQSGRRAKRYSVPREAA